MHRSTCLAAALAAAAACAAPAALAQSASSAATAGTAASNIADAAALPSGLVYRSLREGKGASPSAADRVKVHYRGTFLDGKEFDSSYSRGQPATFPLGRVIRCWTEGVQRMKVGGKAELVCPPQIAYGDKGAGTTIPPNATLKFEVELLEIVSTY